METIAMYFKEGGFVMYVILAVGLLGVAVIIERAIILIHKYNVDARALWGKVSKLIKDGDVAKADALCKDAEAPLLRVLHAGIVASGGTERDIQNAIDEITLEVMPSITKRINHLLTIANIATLIGLLGTVHGLMEAFGALANADPSQKATILARGISIVLYATAFGLLVAIPMLGAYAVLQSKAHKIIDEIDEFSVKLINLLHARKKHVA